MTEALGKHIQLPQTEEDWKKIPDRMDEGRGVLVVNDLDVNGTQLEEVLQKFSAELGHSLLEYDRWPGQSPGVANTKCLALLGNYKARSKDDIVGECKEGERIAEYKPATLELSEWHTDGSFLAVPKTYIALYAPVLNDALPTEGGETRFSSTKLSPAERDEFKNWVSIHSWKSFMRFLENRDPGRPKVTEAQCAAKPDQVWPLVLPTGHVYINAKNTRAIYDSEGKAVDTSFVYELTQRMIDKGIYWHKWKPGQLVIWENQVLIHAATPFDASKFQRLLYRAEFGPYYLKCKPETVKLGYLEKAPPAITVPSGAVIVVDTVSGKTVPPKEFNNVPAEYFEILEAAGERVGPHILTGPIAIDGAEPGDVLQIDILDVRMRSDWAYTLHKKTMELVHTKLSPLAGGYAETEFGSRLECNPFFGILGVATNERVSSIPASAEYGGNLDLKKLTPGSTLYLPVHVAGALLYVGDGHARQGDGECCGTALETALTGKFRLTIHKGKNLKVARAETPEELISIGVEDSLDSAVTSAVEHMVEWIQELSDLSTVDAEVLCSIGGDLAVTQFVNGDTRGAHMCLRKKYLCCQKIET